MASLRYRGRATVPCGRRVPVQRAGSYFDEGGRGAHYSAKYTGVSRQSGLHSDSRARRKLGFWYEILGFWDFGSVLKEIVGTAENFLNVQDSALECAIRLGPALCRAGHRVATGAGAHLSRSAWLPTSGVVGPLDPSGSCFTHGETRRETQRECCVSRRALRVYPNGRSTLSRLTILSPAELLASARGLGDELVVTKLSSTAVELGRFFGEARASAYRCLSDPLH